MSNQKTPTRDWSKVEFPADEVIDVTTKNNEVSKYTDFSSGQPETSSAGDEEDVPARVGAVPRRKPRKREPQKQSVSKDRIIISPEVRAMIESAWLRCLNEGRPMSRIEIIDRVFSKGFRKAFPEEQP